MNNGPNALAREALDRRLAKLRPVEQLAPPPRGWMRAVRGALGMTARQFAARMGVRSQTLSDIERSEASGTIQLNTLRRAAQALNCSLVYALVPNEPLEDMVSNRAKKIATARLRSVEHSMALEDQALTSEGRDTRLERYIIEHLRERDLWDEP